MEEETMIQTPPQPMPMSVPAVDEGREALRKSGKRMLIAAIAKALLIFGLYFVGYLLMQFVGTISGILSDLDIDISDITLLSLFMSLYVVSILLVPSTIFMFLYAFSARKAANGNEKALARSAKHIKNYFMVSAIVSIVTLFAVFVIMLFYLWINSL